MVWATMRRVRIYNAFISSPSWVRLKRSLARSKEMCETVGLGGGTRRGFCPVVAETVVKPVYRNHNTGEEE